MEVLISIPYILGAWNAGEYLFSDPFYDNPPNFPALVLRKASVSVLAVVNCVGDWWNSNPTNFTIYIGNDVVSEFYTDQQNVCFCVSCHQPLLFDSEDHITGFPSYQYGMSNILKFVVSSNFICLSEVNITLTFAGGLSCFSIKCNRRGTSITTKIY
jgi:hypothetical protein